MNFEEDWIDQHCDLPDELQRIRSLWAAVVMVAVRDLNDK